MYSTEVDVRRFRQRDTRAPDIETSFSTLQDDAGILSNRRARRLWVKSCPTGDVNCALLTNVKLNKSDIVLSLVI